MATIRFGDEDRDERGFVKVPAPRNPEPRSLADLLPATDAQAAAPAKKPLARRDLISTIAAALLAGGLLLYMAGSRPAAPPRPAAAPATAQTSGDGSLLPSPPPATAPAVAGRLLIAFASPDGTVLGAIESTRAITPTAHYGDGWIQADVAGSGLVWLRAADSPDLAITGPDLAPRRPAPAAPQAAPAAPPPPPPTPEPCAQAGLPGKMVEVCGDGDLAAEAQAKWLATYGGNPGIVTTPTPQEWNR